MKYQIGRRVRVRLNTLRVEGHPQPGAVGKVVGIGERGAVAVEFCVPFRKGHGCDGKAAEGHGRYFYPHLNLGSTSTLSDLELIPELKEKD